MLINRNLEQTPFTVITDWTLVAGEYYSIDVINPLAVENGGVVLTKGVVGSLAAGEWGYSGNKVYIKDAPSNVRMSQPHTIAQITGDNIMVISVAIGGTADVVFFITDSLDAAKSIQLIEVDGSAHIQGFVLESGDKVKILSSKEDTSALLSASYNN